jgi:hypothetical protein
MPNRILRDWTDSEPVNSLSWQAEVFFTRLIMKVDDFGRHPANTKLLGSILFPLKDGIRDADITRHLAECEEAGLIAVYESESKKYLEIKNFDQRLRLKKSKYPAPCLTHDGQMTVICQSHDGVKRNEVETNRNETNKLASSPSAPKPAVKKLTDEEWLEQTKAHYPGINVDAELRKMDAWLSTRHGKQKTRRFIVNWLNRVEVPLGKTDSTPRKADGSIDYYADAVAVFGEENVVRVASL